MRHLLLKRMESCQQSFKKSIGNLINVHTVFINLLENDREKAMNSDKSGRVILPPWDPMGSLAFPLFPL